MECYERSPGVVEKIRVKCPWLCGNFLALDSHCFAHQLHLACESAYKTFLLSEEWIISSDTSTKYSKTVQN